MAALTPAVVVVSAPERERSYAAPERVKASPAALETPEVALASAAERGRSEEPVRVHPDFAARAALSAAASQVEAPNVFVRVIGPDGSPVPEARVEAWFRAIGSPEPEQPAPWLTDADGRVQARLDAGELRLVAWSQEGVSKPIEREVEPRGATSIELELESGSAFAGSIRDLRTGAPVAGARVSLHTFSPLDVAESAADGGYVHTRYPNTNEVLQVRAEAPGYGPAVAYLAIETDGSWWIPAATDRERARRGTMLPARLDFELLPALSIRGRVLAPDGLPAVDGAVQAEGYFRVLPTVASRDFAEARVDAGHFDLSGLRGDIGHVLIASAPGAADTALEVRASEASVDLGDIHLEPEAIVAGVLIDAAGQPAGGMRLELRAEPATRRGQPQAKDPGSAAALDPGVRVLGALRLTTAGAAGEFRFAGLPGGHYVLSARRDSGALATSAIHLATGEERADLELQLEPGALTLSGQIVGPRGPAAGARIEVARFGTLGGVLADADGVFQVAGLDADESYELAATWIDPESGQVFAARRRAWAHETPRIELER